MISNQDLHQSRGCHRHTNQQLIFLPFLNFRSGVFARSSGKASRLTTDMAELDYILPVQESWPDRPEHALHRVFSYRLYFNRPQGL
jgi:hypothetical protein